MNFWNKKEASGNDRIFLDYASTTPIDSRVSDVMKEVEAIFANPSALYSEAFLAKEKLDESREVIADILNVQKKEIYFTSGGTEGNNISLLGVFEKDKKAGFIPHIITSVVEHSSVLEVCKEIERRGGEVTYLPVSIDGLISPKDVSEALKPETILVSIMYANNEIGTIQPIKEISKRIKNYRQKNNSGRPYFHTDASQVVLYLSLDIMKLGVDLLTLDGIKMYGPRGAGVLYVKTGTKISPIIFGGGQEDDLRSGTENVVAAVGLAKALEISDREKESESFRLSQIRDYGIDLILKSFPKASLNGSLQNRLPNNINICFSNQDAEFLVISLDVNGISASYSSSCRTLKEDSSSYVVESLGKPNCKSSSLRFTLGRESTKLDIDSLVRILRKIVLMLR